jgi:hypothetical protein
VGVLEGVEFGRRVERQSVNTIDQLLPGEAVVVGVLQLQAGEGGQGIEAEHGILPL